jgi:hypothetical protein
MVAFQEVCAKGNPYSVVRNGSRYCVIKNTTSERMKCYDNKADAMAYFRALEANVHDK